MSTTMKTTALALALVLSAALTAMTPAPAAADVLADMRALFEQEKSEDDPFAPVHDNYVALARQAKDGGDLTTALEYYRIASTIDRTDRESQSQVRALVKELTLAAATLYKEGVALYDTGDAPGARALFLKALRLNPGDTRPLAYLRDKMQVQPNTAYTIQDDDTLLRISEKVYGNPGGELLLTRINKLSIADRLKPGETLKVPTIASELSLRTTAELEPAPMAKTPVAQAMESMPSSAAQATTAAAAPAPVTQAASAPASGVDALLAMARIQFRNGLYETAASMTDEILSMDAGQTEARTMQNESLYRLATGLWEKGSASQAMRMLRRLPADYKDSGKLRASVQKKLNEDSEPLYLAGVRHFLNEDLNKAVEQWELALEINPFHAKARADLEKARKLLEAVKGL